jgi:hypothetical protein
LPPIAAVEPLALQDQPGHPAQTDRKVPPDQQELVFRAHRALPDPPAQTELMELLVPKDPQALLAPMGHKGFRVHKV